ncbi:hypothetical protein ABH931_003125 [Streptacidiphilus sp. MAP12-33]|uniref:hypothetical protein n=1 Tax=Streptacidiphilus sp. MAP12-33 TaxID=3156266 RepID=UPI003518E283
MSAEALVYVGVVLQFAGTVILLVGLAKTAQGFNTRLTGLIRGALSGLSVQIGQPPIIEVHASDDAGAFDTATVLKRREPYHWHWCPWVKLHQLGREVNRIQAEVDQDASALTQEASARETADHEISQYMKRQHEALAGAVSSLDAKLTETAIGTIPWQVAGLIVSLGGAILTTIAAMHLGQPAEVETVISAVVHKHQ